MPKRKLTHMGEPGNLGEKRKHIWVMNISNPWWGDSALNAPLMSMHRRYVHPLTSENRRHEQTTSPNGKKTEYTQQPRPKIPAPNIMFAHHSHISTDQTTALFKNCYYKQLQVKL